MTFDSEITLIDLTYTENDMGDVIPIESRLVVLCEVKSITRSEFYQADASGLRPSYTFVINKHDYDKQKLVEFNGEQYRVIREYLKTNSKNLGDFETLELVCEGVINDGTS